MIFSIANLLVKLFGIDFDSALRWAGRFVVGTAAAVLFVAVAVYFAYCSPSRREKRIESRDPIIIEQQQAADHAINAAVNANAEAANANAAAVNTQSAVNAVQRDHRTGVNTDEANRNRCLAFPGSAECH